MRCRGRLTTCKIHGLLRLRRSPTAVPRSSSSRTDILRLSPLHVTHVLACRPYPHNDGQRNDTRGVFSPASLASLEVPISALRSRPALRKWLLLLVLVVLTDPALADSITIGTATYIGHGSWGHPSKTMLAVYLDTRGLIFDSSMPSLPYSLLFDMNVYGWTGWIATDPPTGILIDPPHYCPCEAVVFTMSLVGTGPFRLANGHVFNPTSTITVTIESLPGQTYVQYGQSVNIVLTSQPTPTPEPGSLFLFGSGTIGIAAATWRRRHREST
jgi:hypothetical protein